MLKKLTIQKQSLSDETGVEPVHHPDEGLDLNFEGLDGKNGENITQREKAWRLLHSI